ncbi:MAG: putative ABC transporter ATP-binding protein YxlF [Xylophilus sp.]|nr:MAG: putative ABC transporter ATP-binding protein YxlF [Xylophilus sp.]
MLRVHEVSKAFGRRTVLRQVSHSFAPGLHALQGPNGIGKSTLLTILAGIQAPDSGTVIVDGHDLLAAPVQAKARLAFVPDDGPVYPFLTGRDLLDLVAQAKRARVDARIARLIERLGLAPHLSTRFGQMSLGTQKKTLLAAAWIGQPAVLLLDEPSNALDAVARGVLIEELRALRGTTVVVMSTHDADFVGAVDADVLSFASLQSAEEAGI